MRSTGNEAEDQWNRVAGCIVTVIIVAFVLLIAVIAGLVVALT